MKRVLRIFVFVFDLLFFPCVYPIGWVIRGIRRHGIEKFPRCKNAMLNVGVFPIRSHYYEPQFDYRSSPLREGDRALPGIDWNCSEQLSLLDKLRFSSELSDISSMPPGSRRSQTHIVPEFYINNGSFESGDAEFWYQFVRLTKPRRIFEIGSGNSTLLAARAIRKNQEEDPGYTCKHVCIEPFEAPWLERVVVDVIREKVEDLELSFFSELDVNDILFIDSSHIIRPQGDVTFEFLQILPSLKKGVVVHIHDIFSPRNYPKQWVEDEVMFWNEQYLLEAFLSHNRDWEIVAALNYLHHSHSDKLKSVAPFLTPDREPGSFYIRRTMILQEETVPRSAIH